jgi:hypothetical protein
MALLTGSSVYTASVALTRPSNTTAYTAGDVVGAADTTTAANAGNAILTFGNVSAPGGAIRIDSVDLSINNTVVPSGMDAFRLHLYSVPPAAILDNAAFDLTLTETPRYLGFVTIALPVDIGSTLYSSTVNIGKVVRMLPYSQTLFAKLETRGAYTPASGTLYTVKLSTVEVDVATTGSENLLWAYAGGAVPTLDLEFARTKTLNNQVTSTPPVTFTRASSATFIDSAGTLQTAAVDVPRFDHNPTTGESLGLLVEEQRTNSFLQSQDFSTSWSNVGSSENTNVSVAPDGTQTADALVDTAINETHNFTQNVSGLAGSTAHTFSCFMKKGSTNYGVLGFAPTSSWGIGTGASVFFDLNNGTVGTASNATGTIQALPNGWYRCTATATTVATPETATMRIGSSLTGAAQTYTGTGDEAIYAWGAQLEVGAFPTSYIPTTTAAATRSADVASITGENFSSWYRQDEGTVFAQFRPLSTATIGIAGFDDGTNDNRWRLGRASSGEAQQIVQVLAVNQTTSLVGSLALNGLASTAATVRLNDCSITANGLMPFNDTSCTIPTVNKMTIGSAQALTAAGSAIRRLTYWPQRLPNSTLQAITQ